MTKEEYANMVKDVRNAISIAKGPDYSLSEKEKASTIFRRSLFAVKDINAGDIITSENIRCIRPGYGIAPKYLKNMLGKKATQSIKYGEPITIEFMESLIKDEK